MGEPPSDEATLAGEVRMHETASDADHRVDRAGRRGAERQLTRGDEVGRYVILERIGAGGMGVVYAAWDPKLDRKVALKLLHGDKRDHDQRLEREAQAMARLTHPNVIAVHDVGELDGRVFVAMEYVEGRTLTDWVGLSRGPEAAPSRTPAPEREGSEILDVLLAAGRGLAAAHEQGLIHRDFKPDNVMIGDDGRVRVMDFGLVRAADGAGESGSQPVTEDALAERPHMHARLDGGSVFDTQLTQVGSLLGTPAYMAPEQLRGDGADARADQFGFCVVAWQCLYDARPFAGDTPLAVLFAISHAKFREPEGGRPVPTRIRRALERGLAADPDARWPSMTALLDALADDPRARRRPWLLGGASLAVAIAAASAAIVLQPAAPPSPCAHAGDELAVSWSEARAAELGETFASSELVYADESWTRTAGVLDRWARDWVAARRDACEATEVRREQSPELLDLRMACLDQRLRRFDALLDVLASADDTVIEKAVEAAEALPELEVCSDRAWLTATVRPPDDRELAAGVAALGEDVARVQAMTDGGKGPDALALAEQADARARELAWQPALAEAALALGRVHQERGEFADSRAALERAYFAARRGDHDEATVEAAALLIYTLTIGLGAYDDAAAWIEHARAEAERIGRDDLLAEVWSAIGIHHYVHGDMKQAAAAFERSLELYADTRSSDLASAHINYGTVLIRVDPSRREQALAELQLGLDMLVERVGPRHPSVGVALSNYATVHGKLHEHEAAIEKLERALTINQDALGPAHPMTALVELNLAINLIEVDTPKSNERALALAERSLATHVQVFGEGHARVAESERAVGRALLHLHRPREAIAHFEAAHEIWRASFGDDNVSTNAALRLLARCDAELGRDDAAIARLEAILAHAPDEPELVAKVRLDLAERLVERDAARARELLDAAASELDELDDERVDARLSKLRARLD